MANETKKNEDIQDVDFEQIENATWSPFDSPAKDRDYTKPHVDPSDIEGEIPEPEFKAPSFEDINFDDPTTKSNEPESAKEPERKFNQQFHDLSPKDKEKSAEMMAEIAIDGYGKLTKLLGSFAKVSKSKLDSEFAEGTINPHIRLPIDHNGNTVSVTEYFEEFNKEVDETTDLDPEFVENIRKPLINICKKRGFGMTDENVLTYYVVTDVSQKGFNAFQLMRTNKSILEQLREQTMYMSQGAEQPQPEPKPKQKTQPEAPKENQTKMTEEEEPSYSPDDFEEFTEAEPSASTNAGIDLYVETDSEFVETDKNDNTPEFGDSDLLKHMDKASKK